MDEEEDEGSEGEIEPEYSGMEQPPLTRMLKNILSEYPDDGQILKELIQNAEDAGASEVKILFDDRNINQEATNEKKKPFNKYFKGPALFFHNNAVFSDGDWRGIKMLYSSVKELDPLKVGRFGLGFKSVFHITDYPMIVSGKKLLVINPYTTYSDKVCTSFLLKGLSRYKGMDMKAFGDAFDDIFGFGEETLSCGEYKGTLFRFPLRQVGTELSGNLYDREKIESLFDSFTTEAPMTLLFLKTLEEMTLFRNIHGVKPSYRVKIQGNGSEKLPEKRKKFCQALQEYNRSSMSHDVTCSLHVNVSVETTGQHGLTMQENKTWFIVNTVLGNSHMSPQFRALSQDSDLSYSPYVGIAIPYEDMEDFKGHVFCFLPLPLEERSLTGLPVHLNGFFALSQNRRHVKWPSADLKKSAISADKSLQWNQALIKEALSQVYLSVIQDLITKCSGGNNPENLVAMVYRSISDCRAVDVKWRGILDPLVNGLLQTNFLYTENNGGRWIQPGKAVFELPDCSTDIGVRETLRLIMKQYQQNLVIIPPHITALLNQTTRMTLLDPAYIGNLLRRNSMYENCNSHQKLHLLQFLMSDKQYFSLEGLKLLPLENGSFASFDGNGCVYMCKESTMKLIPGCAEHIVKQDLPEAINQHLQNIKDRGMFQIQKFDVHGFVRLLQLSMDRNLTEKGQYKVWDTERSTLPLDWLEKVWSKLAESSLTPFKDVHLVPVKNGKYYHLHRLTSLFIVKSYRSHTLPETICKSMTRFSVTVLSSLPSYMAEHSEVTKYIHTPTQESFLSLLDRLYTNSYAFLQSFNADADKEERYSWMKYLDNLNVRNFGGMLLRHMKIFKELGNSAYTSISQVDTLAPKLGYDFPVRYPRRLLSSSDSCQCRVAQNLGATQLTEEAVFTEVLSENKWHTYSDSDKKNVMLYFIREINQFNRNHILMGLAANARFVPTSTRGLQKPTELYDPSITFLRELIGDDSMFPADQFSSSEILLGLRVLGLNSNPSGDLIYSCISNLDRKVKQGHTSNVTQAEAVNHFLSQQLELLNQYSLMDKKFLVPKKRTSDYPAALPWFCSTYELCAPQECFLATTRNQRIAGSVIPLVSENSYSYLKNSFYLLHPLVTDVLNHLLQIKRNYEVELKPDLLPCISEVYRFLAQEISTSSDIEREIRDFFSVEPLVWTGETFVEVTAVYTTHNPEDIPLEPYMYCLPREFLSIKQFFEVIRCHRKQTVEGLRRVQNKIKDKHDQPTSCSRIDVEKDLNITVQILTKYKQDPASVDHLDVLFPVHTGSETKLQLMRASECRYSNEEWLKVMAEEDEETIYYVHANIPPHTAQALGVRSLTEGLLTDTEAIEPCGQHEDLTGRIKGLLDGYTDGLSVPKEIVQNADDGGATKVCFLYDERENIDARTRLIDEKMSSFQGPALWAYNNAQFTEADLHNITKLGGATKQENDTKIGKFGLGFCSVYNLTDVPSFITGTDLVIFDPHYNNLGSAVKGKEAGIKINLRSLQNQRLVRRMKNQFKPFNGVFGCDMTMGEEFHLYEGTLFRLPLRTNEQADKSEIKDSAYTRSDMKELLHMLMENGGNMLLFTQNVTEIEVYHLPANATDPSQSTLLYTATKNMIDSDDRGRQNSDTFNILKEVSALYSPVHHSQMHVPTVQKIIQTDINIQVENAAELFISNKMSETRSCTRWIIAYATGTSKSLDISKQVKGVLPLAGVATPITINGDVIRLTSLDNMPFGFYQTGHYFSFLPLPIQTGLPVHINATFAVAPDRRSIMWGTEDDRTELIKPRWNHSLMTDAVPKAYVCLLESLHNYNGIIDEEYMNIWPIYQAPSSELQHMQKAFLTTIVEETPRVFKRHDIWARYEDCRFVDPELLNSEVGDIAFKAAIHFLETKAGDSLKVMKLQKNLDTSFRNAGLEHAIRTKIFSKENFFTEVLFPEMLSDFWQSRERNMLVMFAVDNMTETTKKLLLNTKCIPSEPTGEMKYPNDLIHPDSKLKTLFTRCEGRFVHGEMIEAGIKQRKEQLAAIGMIVDTLPPYFIIDKVQSVLGLSLECDKCAVERSVNIIKYIQRKCLNDKTLIEQTKDIPYLPILKKPNDWTFLWRADCQSSDTVLTTTKKIEVTACNHEIKENVRFAKPRCLYLTSAQHLVGSQELVMDVSCYKECVFLRGDILSRLGVNGENHNTIPIKVVCEHLIEICKNTDPANMTENSKRLLKKICNEVYTFLSRKISNETLSEEEMNCITELKELPVVFCHNVFVKPKQTALHILVDCEPHLFGLRTHHLRNRCNSLVRVLDIKDKFTTDDILGVMQEIQNEKGKEKLTEDELELYTKLIKVLVKCIEFEDMDYYRISAITNVDGVSTPLCIPDIEDFLTPINQLCLNDNAEIKTTGKMKFVNGKIGPDFARRLGVKAKIKQHLSENSKPFGQKEELATRIKEVLEGYPCDEGIMKELLQNADDAQATELQFIIDDNTYSTEKVFDDNWNQLQGPALLVYNDSMFSAKDIQGIQDLGIGSKGDDPTKTGQYGVGFNAVYHLTDAPSFLTKGPLVEGGETMCVMDPYCQFLSDATEERPGIQLLNLDEHRGLYPDVFKCYHEDKLLKSKGTVFRFPLRANDKTKKNLAAPMSVGNLRDLLKTFEGELLDSLLFVNSVKRISLSDISTGELESLYEVEIHMSEGDERKRTDFGNHLRDINKSFKDTQDEPSIHNTSVSYNVTVKDSEGVSNTWLVVQQIGFGNCHNPGKIIDAYKDGNLRLLPRGGVAIRLSSHTSEGQRHKAFCFLPLPIHTGLPVHVNGHFALGQQTRSSLWNEEQQTYRWEWNKLLLCQIIPSAYIEGMQRMKQMLLTDVGESGLVRETYQLDNLFPIYKEAKDDNWKLLAKEVLNQIYNGHHELFYLYKPLKSNVTACQPMFVSLQQPEEPFPALFNTLNYRKRNCMLHDFDERKLLQMIMKGIGLRLLDSPRTIFHSLKAAEVPVAEISPEAIMEFMKSYNQRNIKHKCNIVFQEDCTDLSNTSLQNPKNVLTLLKYCRDSKEFVSRITGVPLCLTEDRKLQAFREGSEIFCSDWFSILPGSGNRFLDGRLVFLCNVEELQKKVFKPFDIPSFAKYLGESLRQEQFKQPNQLVELIPENKTIPNSTWIRKVWRFLTQQKKKCKGKGGSDGTSKGVMETVLTIPQELVVVAHWNLVPCTLLESTHNRRTIRNVLTSLSNFDKVLNVESFTGELKDAIEKLALPAFDTELLESSVLLSLIPNHRSPVMVLNCLYLHRHKSGFQNLSTKNSSSILEYFTDHIKDIQKLDGWKIKLKSLPLHCTVHGELVSLDIARQVLVLPAEIPANGIQKWGELTRTLLLKQNTKLESLYNAFEYRESQMCDVYSSHILTSIECLPKDCISVHLEYIQNKLLLARNDEYDTHQDKLITALKELSIFATKRGGLKSADELYSPHVPLFQAMSDIVDFPIFPYATIEWKWFMELIGMINQASNELLIQFAYQIEAEGRREITDVVQDNSGLLLEYIWELENLVENGLLHRIRKIKFIVPTKICQEQENIYPQYEAGQLMAFEGAVPNSYSNFVWSSCSILPETVNPFQSFNKKKSDAVSRQLQVCLEKPPLEKVILHTQNVCDALKEQCERNIWKNEDAYLKSLLSDIYQYLWDHGAKQDSDLLYNHLCQAPVVYLPSENKLVTCGVLVINLKENQNIKPYLYSAPRYFGANFDLFEKLGTEQTPTCATYARVLERIKQEVGDQELNANERQFVLKAIDGLFSHLPTTDDTGVCLQVPILYLPTENYKLMDSTKMIYSNNDLFYKAIGSKAGLPYFVGFKSLELNYFCSDVAKIPLKYRPHILTRMVEQRIDLSNVEVTQGRFTNQLQDFIQRPEFVEGLLRMSHHEGYGLSLLRLTKKVNESDVVPGLQRIKVRQVKDLTVNFVYKEKVVGCSKDLFCHIHKEGNDHQSLVWYFYIKCPEGMEKTLWLRKIETKLKTLILKSSNIDCFRHGSMILKFLMEMDRPEMISVILDEDGFQEYRLPESLWGGFVPACGTYVHEKWHHMLDNTLYIFDIDEYVALQLHDEETIDYNSSREEGNLYMYAKIVKLIGCDVVGDLSPELTKYEVDVGEDRVVVKFAYEMYKILRRNNVSRELVQAVDVGNICPIYTLPRQVIFREVRRKLLVIWNLPDRKKKAIFKRYLRQWHPDKNIGNEEQATAVFQYIMLVWDKLTNGETVSVDDDVDSSDYSPSRPSPNRQFYDDVSQQCSSEKEHYQESSASREGCRGSHRYDRDPVSNPMQQRKWFNQAKLDLAAAKHFMQSAEEVQAYNWICYMSHQAVEKSLKSMMYRRDANNVNKGHDICGIAASLKDDSLSRAAGEMQSLLGYHTHMRYPDVHAAGRIPSTFFTRGMAESALSIARRILDEVDAKN